MNWDDACSSNCILAALPEPVGEGGGRLAAVGASNVSPPGGDAGPRRQAGPSGRGKQ